MIREILMPQLTMAMSEGMIVEWQIAEGTLAEQEEPLLTIETEKVTTEIIAPYDGYLHITVPEGETVSTETVIGFIADTQEEYASLISPNDAGTGSASASPSTESVELSGGEDHQAAQATQPQLTTSHVAASGLARKLSADHGVELASVAGSGPRGRTVKRDVLEAVAAREAALQATASSAATQGSSSSGAATLRQIIPVAGVRKVIAERMVEAQNVAAPTHGFFEVDITKLVSFRKTYLQHEAQLGTRVSMITLYAKALALALKSVPIANATLTDNEISVWNEVHIGIAVALPGDNEIDSKLIVPVLRDADSRSVVSLDLGLKDLTRRARTGELTVEDLQGATITLSSTDGFYRDGWMISAPILNLPQVASFQPGSVVRKPIVVDDEIVIRDILPCAITFDHRAFDGQILGQLITRVGNLLSNPELMLL